MGEDDFADNVAKGLNTRIPAYRVERKKNILYKLSIDPSGNVSPAGHDEPSRGDYAFQTDILVSNEKVPLVVIETKIHNPTTHDILTYSTKALKHKDVYPYLRYGLLVYSDHGRISRKFFVHNTGFDFALAVNDSVPWLDELAAVVTGQIEISKTLTNALGGQKFKKYVTRIETS